ncbi:hypothetical protein [Lamprocystis purpurea]|jgi:hypothetical protein|nr:hypothetical protein [Lamprocystis purpurea]
MDLLATLQRHADLLEEALVRVGGLAFAEIKRHEQVFWMSALVTVAP